MCVLLMCNVISQAEHDDKDGLQSFTMSKALELLHSEISAEVRHHKQVKCDQQWRGWFSAFHHRNVRSQYHWTTCVLTFLLAVLLLVAKGFGTNRFVFTLFFCSTSTVN